MLDDFDFTLLESPKFKEDSVRERIILPILQALGFEGEKALKNLSLGRSVTVSSDSVLGANKRVKAKDIITPDYLLYIDGKAFCVLDAKAPKVNVELGGDAERQAFFYAINKDIRAKFYALCNGHKFTLFEVATQSLVLNIDIAKELNAKFKQLQSILTNKKSQISTPKPEPKHPDSWYLEREIPKPISNPEKQAAKRYFGCNAYFTRQSWKVVAENIKNFTAKGDVVLDSFGGSGVTAIEAMMNGRLGIHTDLNPLSIFMTKALTAKVNLGDFHALSEKILAEFSQIRPKNQKEAEKILKHAKYYPNAIDAEFGELATAKMQDEILWIPKDEPLLWTTASQELYNLYKLFSITQLVELALLRKLIFKHTIYKRKIQREMRYSLLLAFYNTLSLINKTYRSTTTGGGNNFAYYYRYKLAKEPCYLDIVKTFKNKVKLIKNGKSEIENSAIFYQSYFEPLNKVIKDFSGALMSLRSNLDKTDAILDKINGEKIFQADATNLKEIENESVDFIYTDPPYGAKIPYLDLSTMWNAWLDLPVDLKTRKKECIEQGSLKKSSNEYRELMIKSIKEMFRVLKYNRWLAFVFQHQDPQLWQILRTSAEEIGFEYVQTIRQSNGQMTMKQKQHTATMVSGQLIVYFRKVRNKETILKNTLGDNTKTLIEVAKNEIIQNEGATFAQINDALVMTAMNEGFLDEYLEISDMKNFVLQHFDYDKETKTYHCSEAKEVSLPLEKKAVYFIKSYLNKCKKENRPALFSDICYEIIPKLVNGVTPDSSYIRDILKKIAVVVDSKKGEWKLRTDSLFDEGML